MKYQMIISDYDGTLTESGKNFIDSETISAINAFTTRGGKFIICSGRPIGSTKKVMEEYGLKGVVVGLQGAVIRDTKTDTEIYAKGLEPNFAVKLLNELSAENGDLLAYVGDRLYFSKETSAIKIYQEMLGLKGFLVESLNDFILRTKKPVSKIGVLAGEEKVKEIVKKYNEKYNQKGATFNSGYKYMAEVVSPDYDKGKAVKFLAEYFNIPFEKIITVGDSTNDIPLLDGAWHGVCVGDGHEDLKKIAKEITVPLSESPIKTLIEKYSLN